MNGLKKGSGVALATGVALMGFGIAHAGIGVDMTDGGGPWALGTKDPESLSTKNITITNNGNCYEDIKIRTSNSSPGNWTPGSVAGLNIFCLRYNATALTNSDYTIQTYVAKTASLAPAILSFTCPTGGSTRGVQQTITVTTTAYPIPGYTYNVPGDYYWKDLGTGNWDALGWAGIYERDIHQSDIDIGSATFTLASIWDRSINATTQLMGTPQAIQCGDIGGTVRNGSRWTVSECRRGLIGTATGTSWFVTMQGQSLSIPGATPGGYCTYTYPQSPAYYTPGHKVVILQ